MEGVPPLLTLFSGVQIEAITTVPGGPRRGRSWGLRWWVRGSAILLERGVTNRPESQPLPLPEVNSEPHPHPYLLCQCSWHRILTSLLPLRPSSLLPWLTRLREGLWLQFPWGRGWGVRIL